jgi:putative phosphoribosyl transferase
MPQAMPAFVDRRDAGQRLAAELKAQSVTDAVVLALPRGGVPVGFEVAEALDAPLDVLLVRKLGAPGYEEFGIGAVVDGAQPQIVLNPQAIELLQVPPAYVAQERDRQLVEIERRRRLYCSDAQPAAIAGRTAIVVDDGVATGGTVSVALRALHNAAPKRTILAVPVAAADALARISGEADEILCLSVPADFRAVGAYYADFEQISDEEVVELLARRRAALAVQRGSP